MRQLIVWALILMLFLSGCRAASHTASTVPPEATANPKTDATLPSVKPVPATQPQPVGGVSQRGQLMGKADDQEHAQEIADLYGITLVDFGHGLALYYTEEDPEAVIARGEENDWPMLSLNRTKKLH